MKTKILATRNEEWIAAQRLATAENTPTAMHYEVELAALPEEARAILLDDGGGRYRERYEGLGYGTRPRKLWAFKLVPNESLKAADQIGDAILRAQRELAAHLIATLQARIEELDHEDDHEND